MPNDNLVQAAPISTTTTTLPPLTDEQTNKVIDNIVKHFSDVGIQGFPHPNISPVAIDFGYFELRWYSLAYLFGIILGWLIIGYFNKKKCNNYINTKAYEALPLWIVISVILGGRIGYVLFYNLTYYLNNPTHILSVWEGGMSFHGGLAGVIVGTFIFSKLYNLEFLKVTDFLALVTPIGIFFGRIANFINQELVGKICNHTWCVIYKDESIGRHPSQLYEAASEGLLLFIILFITAKFFNGFSRKGLLSGLFLTFYGIFRASCELFREPDKQIGYLIEGLSMGQILCIPMIMVGLFIMFKYSRTKHEI